MASLLPNISSRDAIIRSALDEAATRATEERSKLEDLLKKERAAQKQLGKETRWNRREHLDISKRIIDLEKKLQTQPSRAELRVQFEKKEKTYSKALEDISKSKGSRLITSSIHSATKSTRRSNIVLLSSENAEECLRQHLRADLGLQEKPILLTAGDVCDDCGLQMCVVANDSMLSCSKCHKVRVLTNTMTTSSLHGGDADTNTAITKHRLPEWIEMAQANEFSEPPADVLESVAEFLIQNKMTGLEDYASEICKERKKGPFLGVEDAVRRLPSIPNLYGRLIQINTQTARIALRGLATQSAKGSEKYRKFYERSAKVSSLVSGFWPPRMNTQQEEYLRMLYTVAAPEYEKRRKPRQTYWPGGFPFFLRCVCILLGWDEFAEQFPAPSVSKESSSRDALREEIWAELGWELVPYSGTLSKIKLPDGTMWSGVLNECDKILESDEMPQAQMKKEIEAKITIKKRRRVDFDMECS